MATSSSVTAPLLRLIDSPGSVIIKQGAEAKVYRSQLFREPPQLFLPAQDPSQQASTSSASTLPAPPVLIKYRFPKHYRHKSLSESITAQRTISEARALVRCARNGVSVPGVVAVDDKSGVLALEWIDGKSVRELLGGGAEDDEVEDSLDGAEADEAEEEEIVLEDEDVKIALMILVGQQLAQMHSTDVVHGDLTTSNMMVRPRSPRQTTHGDNISNGSDSTTALTKALSDLRSSLATQNALPSTEVVLIDFGLSSNSTTAEDKAVDLYVLERAFLSTHPDSKHLFDKVLQSYGEHVELLWKHGEWRKVQTQQAAVSSNGKQGNKKGSKQGSKQNNKKPKGGAAGQQGATPSPLADVAKAAMQAVSEVTQALSQAAVSATSPAQESPWREISRKLDEVRLRGRKRSMVG